MYDIIIIGGGPAGLTAAVYTARANKTALVIEKASFGGQITFSPKVENIPGFCELSGNEFAEKLVDQAINQGVEFESAEVVSVKDGEIKKVYTDNGKEYECKAVIIATGAKHRLLGLHKEEQFIGEGISFCAVCDGAFYKGKTVGIIGGGNSALQEALLLSELASKVYVVQNLLELTGEKKLQEQIYSKANIVVITGTVVNEIIGDSEFKGISIKNVSDNSISELLLDGLFIAIGLIPQNEVFSELIELDARGYADSNESCKTKAEGIYVAGDCRTKNIRQVVTAASDGAVAALAACDYIDSL